MSTFLLAAICLILAIALISVWSRWRKAARADYIRTYMFPPGLLDKFGFKRPDLSLKENSWWPMPCASFFSPI